MNMFANISLPDMSIPHADGPVEFLFWMMVVVVLAIRHAMKEDK